MFKEEEEKLTDYKNSYDKIQVPDETLNEAIISGFQKAKAEQKQKPQMKKWMISLAAAAIILFTFLSTIRLSPAFAGYVASIPGMEKLVELIRNDKGMIAAVENDYYQELGVSEKKGGLEVTIDGAIADEKGLVLFYTMRSDEKLHSISVDRTDIRSLDDKKLEISSISYGQPKSPEEDSLTYNGTIEYFFKTPLQARELEVSMKVNGKDIEEYQLAFTLDDEKIKGKKTYELNKTVTIEDQKITIVDVTVYPIRVAIHVKMDESNSMELFDFEDLRLVDENGEIWNKINNGLTAQGISDHEKIFYLQSNYFREPEELHVVFNKIQAVEKDEAKVVVDVKNERIIQQPKGNKLKSVRVEGGDLVFEMPVEKEFPYSLFGRIYDEAGNELNSGSSYSYNMDDEGIKVYGVSVENLKKQTGPISFEISFFPSWIEGEGRAKIK